MVYSIQMDYSWWKTWFLNKEISPNIAHLYYFIGFLYTIYFSCFIFSFVFFSLFFICQMIRNVNKEKWVTFCKQLVADSENFVDIIFTDECTVQLHDNKVVIYHLKDEVVPPIPKPKHPLRLHAWGGISRQGTTPLLIFDGT